MLVLRIRYRLGADRAHDPHAGGVLGKTQALRCGRRAAVVLPVHGESAFAPARFPAPYGPVTGAVYGAGGDVCLQLDRRHGPAGIETRKIESVFAVAKLLGVCT